ncbi:transcription elongation factor Elf1 [Methanocalculus alkaliphilus]|uniref:hypothetical protein n=1 Tax=Methanocalculus alkaliphilus TaxID=768730 RepID=UPI0020A144E9|nr:hypothetical protein [Methanocalculus alkaliphilus]MCP1714674.1 transcription elongation factor Elf1 [Methanocalculus alkaliphilus]
MVLSGLHCPQCGEMTVVAERPSDNEIWIKCGTCDLFIGLSEEEWNRIRASENREEKIRSIYQKLHPRMERVQSCRFCSAKKIGQMTGGSCTTCLSKALIIVLIILIVSAFIIWYGLF